jgi:hypothetical protein
MQDPWILSEQFASTPLGEKFIYIFLHIPNFILVVIALYVIGVDLYYVLDLRKVIKYSSSKSASSLKRIGFI